MKKTGLLILLLFIVFQLSAQPLYRFEKNGKYGFKNPSGKIVVKPVYDYASDTVFSLGGVRNKEKWAVINNAGDIITGFNYSGGVGKTNGFDLVPVFNENGIFGVNKYYGIVNKEGKEIAAPHYTYVDILTNELAVVGNAGKYGIVNAYHQVVLPIQFTDEQFKIFTGFQPNGVYYENGQWKAFSLQGYAIQKWKYDDIVLQGEYLWPVKLRNKWGFVDTLGRELVAPSFDSVGIYGGGITWVSVAGKKGVMDNKGDLILPVKYDGLFMDQMGNYILFSNGKYGLADKKGKEFAPVKYSYVSDFKEGLAPVQLNGKWGFIDLSGKEVIVPAFEGVLPFSDGLAAFVQNKKIGFINKSGNVVITPQYDQVVESFYKSRAIVVRQGKEIYIDVQGKEVN